ncbi:MAG: hypothetical protein AB3X44_17150 [Leptothrix sp. (in: b-proteobacteria)]
MATQDLIAALIAQLGTAQPERDDPRRDPAWAPLDDRDADGLLRSLRALAPLIRHYERSPGDTPGDWQAYFPAETVAELEALAQHSGARVAPHHALLLAFLQLLARPQALLNRFTAEHLQFQMQRVLGFQPLPPQPDHAHLVLELKKGAAALEVNPDHRFSAGKDARKVEQLFAPVRSTVVGAARIARLASVVHQGGRLLFAPRADSADGLGAALPVDVPRWPPFGRASLPPAPVGFALAAPVLRLTEGERNIELKLRLNGWPAGLSAADFAASFEGHLTGPKGWLGPLPLSAILTDQQLTLRLHVGADVAAIVDHDPAVHLHAFPAALPVLQCLLKGDAALGFDALTGLTLERAQLTVQVSGMRTLSLENDDATLSPKKAFLPFGAQPVVGARFHVGCPEALGKQLSSLSIHLAWQGAPPDLFSWYDGYTRRSQMSNGIGASVSWQDASGAAHASASVTLLPRLAGPTTIQINASGTASAYSPAAQAQALQWSGSAMAKLRAGGLMLAQPVRMTAWPVALLSSGLFATVQPVAAAARAGFVTLTLVEDLLHGDFRRDALAAATPPADPTGFVPKILNTPYAPKVQEITLDYSAHSDDSRIGEPTQAAFTDTELQFFQIDALGLAREHAWLATTRPWAPQGAVRLLPPHPAAGEWCIGLAGVGAGDSVSLLLQVAEGSANPLVAAQKLQWSVLADNAWRPLGAGEVVLDTTHDLRKSGLLACVLPAATTTDNSRAPAGLAWLRAAIPLEPSAACDLIGVHANAIEVVFVDQGNDPQRLAQPLPAGSIAKLATPLAALKSVSQPYASFGASLVEDDAALTRRAAERLRHRNRAITGWDIERLVLQAFPQVYRAKCIPHASATSWLAAGHLMLVLVPDLRQLNAVDALQPRVDLETLTQVRDFVLARSSPQTQVHVRNPSYQPVQLDCKVRLRAGYGFAFYGPQIDLALRRALSPWAFDDAGASARLGFGGRVVRSALLDVVESLPWVDFVTDFRLARAGRHEDLAEIMPAAPDEILVSAATHHIEELSDG